MTTEHHCHCQLCLHHRKWHVMGVCRWCGRMELRYPNANWMPGHEFVSDPEVVRRLLSEALEELEYVTPKEERRRIVADLLKGEGIE